MGEMDDPLQKFLEHGYDRLNRDAIKRFPHRRADIFAQLMQAGSEKKYGGKRARGVKGSRGRPPVNKSVLAAWVDYLAQIISLSKFPNIPNLGGSTLTDEDFRVMDEFEYPSLRWALGEIVKMGLLYIIGEGANPIS